MKAKRHGLVVCGLIFLCSSLFDSSDVFSATLGKFRNTHYYLVPESDYIHQPLDTTIRDLNDNILAHVSRAFRRAVDIEGTGQLIDGRVINFSGVKENEIRYTVTPYEFGFGVGDCPLIPFHTVAVDPKVIPLGSIVQIDETIGMVLPDGSLHDGLWRAEDIGGAIKKDRIDLFVGVGDQGEILRRAHITHLKPLTVRLVTPPPADSCVYRQSLP